MNMKKSKQAFLKNRASKMSIDRCCKIKKYIRVKEKIDFTEKYIDFIKKQDFESIKEYQMNYINMVYFELFVLRYYTDLDINIEISDYDELQESNAITEIIEYIGEDCKVLTKLILSFLKDNNK